MAGHIASRLLRTKRPEPRTRDSGGDHGIRPQRGTKLASLPVSPTARVVSDQPAEALSD